LLKRSHSLCERIERPLLRLPCPQHAVDLLNLCIHLLSLGLRLCVKSAARLVKCITVMPHQVRVVVVSQNGPVQILLQRLHFGAPLLLELVDALVQKRLVNMLRIWARLLCTGAHSRDPIGEAAYEALHLL
jgi:hypothetical protein